MAEVEGRGVDTARGEGRFEVRDLLVRERIEHGDQAALIGNPGRLRYGKGEDRIAVSTKAPS